MNYELFTPVLGYIGPGAGMGLIMALVGLVVAVGAAFMSIALWPIRNMLKRKRQPQNDGS